MNVNFTLQMAQFQIELPPSVQTELGLHFSTKKTLDNNKRRQKINQQNALINSVLIYY